MGLGGEGGGGERERERRDGEKTPGTTALASMHIFPEECYVLTRDSSVY